MEELKKLTEEELKVRIFRYVKRIDVLEDQIREFLECRGIAASREEILEVYKELKREIKEDAHYVSLSANSNRNNRFYSAYFKPNIAEAAAFGMKSSTNCAISHKLSTDISEARYKLLKGIPYSRNE